MPFISGAIAAIGAIATGIGSFIGGSVIGSILLKTVVGIGLNLLASAIAGKPEKPKFSIKGQLDAGGDLPRSFIMGWRATAGSLVYANTWGTDGTDTPNTYLTQVIALSDVPVAELVGFWVNEEKVTISNREDHMGRGFGINEYRAKEGWENLWIKFYDGTQTSADSFLVNRVSSSQRPYENTRVGRGIAYVIVTARVSGEMFSGFPSFKFEVNGMKLYDPSKDSTVGGSGSHRWNNPATWGGDGDHLPAVQIYNLLRGIHYNGEWLYGLQNMTAARLPADNWIAAIEKCREEVKSGGEMVPQFRSSIEIPVEAPLADAIEGLLTSCQGRISEIGGTYKIHLGKMEGPADFFLDDDQIISTSDQTFTPFFGLDATVNGISATYPSPEDGWNAKPAPPRYNAQFEAEDGNRRLVSDAPLDCVPYKGQVQRLMKFALQEARRARRHTFTLPPEFWPVEPGDLIRWTSPRNGYDSKWFRVDGVIDMANLDVMVDLTECHPNDYDWNDDTDYTPVTDGALGPIRPPAQPMVGFQAFPASIEDDEGDGRRPSIEVSYAGQMADVQSVRIQVRLPGHGLIFNGRVPYGNPEDNDPVETVVVNGVFLPNLEYEVRTRFEPKSGRPTDWSGWAPVTTPDDRFGAKDLDDAIYNLQETYGSLIRDAIDELRAFAVQSASQDFANYADRRSIRRELHSVTGAMEANFTEAIDVATGPNSALAQAITEVNASNDGTLAGATFKIAAGYDSSDGWSSRIGLQTRVSPNDGFSDAGLFLESRPTGSRVLLMANQVAIADTDGTVSALFEGDTTNLNNANIQNLNVNNIAIGGIETQNIALNQVTQTLYSQASGGTVGPNPGDYISGMINVIDYTAGAVTGATSFTATISDTDTIAEHIAAYSDDGDNWTVIGGASFRAPVANENTSGTTPYAFKPTAPGPWYFAFILRRRSGTGTITFVGGTHVTLYHQR